MNGFGSNVDFLQTEVFEVVNQFTFPLTQRIFSTVNALQVTEGGEDEREGKGLMRAYYVFLHILATNSLISVFLSKGLLVPFTPGTLYRDALIF